MFFQTSEIHFFGTKSMFFKTNFVLCKHALFSTFTERLFLDPWLLSKSQSNFRKTHQLCFFDWSSCLVLLYRWVKKTSKLNCVLFYLQCDLALVKLAHSCVRDTTCSNLFSKFDENWFFSIWEVTFENKTSLPNLWQWSFDEKNLTTTSKSFSWLDLQPRRYELLENLRNQGLMTFE